MASDPARDRDVGGTARAGEDDQPGRNPRPVTESRTEARGMLAAARRRTPPPTAPEHPTPTPRSRSRPRVEVTVNELTGTMSWRTLDRPTRTTGAQGGGPGTQHRRTPEAAPRSARAAALRSAGPDLSRAPAKGAAPVPTHPAAVRAALSVDIGSLTPEGQRSHLARLGALRSGATADLARGTRMPTAVASRLRSTSPTPAHTHALATRHTSAATRPPAPGPSAHRPTR